ncbi:alpha-ketoglutarate-dependent dioxygenase AlkB family protein [Streptomyces zhihengii]|uniref:alpha-ketoglutarate-dependent dioxygenase AlkB family protein n=1 Tax=Streptomyces zhihengii TaxID=1818004 RepID=UPI003693F6B0
MNEELFPRERAVVAPGAVHVPGWLGADLRRELVDACRAWGRGPVPFRHTALPGGGVMSVRTVCLGWHWQPYRYSRTADDVNGARVAAFPPWLVGLGRRALAEAYGEDAGAGGVAAGAGGVAAGAGGVAAGAGGVAAGAGGYTPDTALINFYEGNARMGMHRDREERSTAPVVSLSIGDPCVFRFGNTASRGRPWTDVELRSGDLFVFGGPSRFAYHGVPKVLPGAGDPAAGLAGGRLNITLRETGLPRGA